MDLTFNYGDRYFVVEERESFVNRLPVDPTGKYERLGLRLAR